MHKLPLFFSLLPLSLSLSLLAFATFVGGSRREKQTVPYLAPPLFDSSIVERVSRENSSRRSLEILARELPRKNVYLAKWLAHIYGQTHVMTCVATRDERRTSVRMERNRAREKGKKKEKET